VTESAKTFFTLIVDVGPELLIPVPSAPSMRRPVKKQRKTHIAASLSSGSLKPDRCRFFFPARPQNRADSVTSGVLMLQS